MKKSFFTLALVALGLLVLSDGAWAQQKIAYVDTEYISSKLPEFKTVEQTINRLAQDWEQEVAQKQQEVDNLFNEYQARELLYTQEERQRKQQEIVDAEADVERLRMQYFGPEGEYFRQQEQQLRPVQEKVFAAIEEVAQAEGYDYVFDKSGDLLFLYALEKYDLSNQVLEELGIEIDERTGRGGRR